jgi:Fe-S oxidoreductase
MGRLLLVKRGASPEDLYKSFSLCTLCKRCAYFCPLGLDVAETTRQMRDVLSKSDRLVPYVAKVVDNFLKHGNNVGMPPKVVSMAIRALAKKIEREKGVAPRLYLFDGERYIDAIGGEEKSPGRRVALLFPSSSDIFEFEEAFRGYVYLLNLLRYDVVVSIRLADTANYGYYLNTEHMYKIADMYLEQIRLIKPHVVAFGECGHGWHVFSRLVAPRSPAPTLHIHQLLYQAYRRNELKIRRIEVKRPVVYMDPCNYSRGAVPLTVEPRALLKAAVGEYVELWKNPRESICCLGGGGLIAPEALDVAVNYWKKAYGGVDFGTAVRPCATCKAQLKRVFKALGVGLRLWGWLSSCTELRRREHLGEATRGKLRPCEDANGAVAPAECL